jgi:hypothetical protein
MRAMRGVDVENCRTISASSAAIGMALQSAF